MTPSDINDLFEALLGRSVDAQATESLKTSSLAETLKVILGSPEHMSSIRSGPLWSYTADFDALGVVRRYEHEARKPVLGHRVNYLGVAVNVDRFIPGMSLENVVEPVPLPSNWHADIAEFAAALRAVDLSGDRFTVLELGCGWGCWMNIAGVAARSRGKVTFLMGVEGDEGHLAFARESLATNGFGLDQYRLVRGIAAARDGTALFPRQDAAGASWGLEPVFGASVSQIAEARGSGSHDELPMVPLAEVLGDRPRLDLLHIDIQGGEADLIRDSLPFLAEKVAYIVVGTHSRVIDGRIIDALTRAGGWRLEIERPCLFSLAEGRLTTTIDGVQGWRNMRLCPTS